MMPGWQTGRVHGKARLPRQWTTENFTAGQDCRSLSSQADGFAQFLKMFCLQGLAGNE
jgi:hypothetical protein